MDPRLLNAYNKELTYLREMGKEFAKEYPKVASKLSLDNIDQPDPLVERLVESFAFLSARIAIEQDEHFSKFTEHLLDVIYPSFLQPTPSTAIVQLECDPHDSSLATGLSVKKESVLKTTYQKGVRTHCEFRTTMDATLWPIILNKAKFSTSIPNIPSINAKTINHKKLAGTLSLMLSVGGGLNWNQLTLNELSIFLASDFVVSHKIYEHLLSKVCGVVINYKKIVNEVPESESLYTNDVRIEAQGFKNGNSLFIETNKLFSAHGLVKEYFVLPQKFFFLNIIGLKNIIKNINTSQLEVHFLLTGLDKDLVNLVDTQHFKLNCVPIVNLFYKTCDRIFITDKQKEFIVYPEKTRLSDFEVIEIDKVTGISAEDNKEIIFEPFYSLSPNLLFNKKPSYYSKKRQKSIDLKSDRETSYKYVAMNTYISLLDYNNLPFGQEIKQLSVDAWCSNRDLPLLIKFGMLETDLNIQGYPLIKSVRFLIEPTQPKSSLAGGELNWQLINLLSSNYLSMLDMNPQEAALLLQKMLFIYAANADSLRHHIKSLKAVHFSKVVRRLSNMGPFVYVQGLEVKLVFDESLFDGAGCFLLGQILSEILKQMVTVNSFVETVVESIQRGELKRWPHHIGSQSAI